MTDRLHRSRVLPEGYQFGDCARVPAERCPLCEKQLGFLPNWGAFGCWRCHFVKDRGATFVFSETMFVEPADSVVRKYDVHFGDSWNVIEGETFTTDHDCGDENAAEQPARQAGWNVKGGPC